MLSLLQVFILAIIQGLCELLPVSSSAHVIVAEKLMGLDPAAPAMTLLLVMLHTGTMFAVIVYFRKGWIQHYFSSPKAVWTSAQQLFLATLCTGIVGVTLKIIIEKIFMKGLPHAEIEQLFSNLPLIAIALASVGLLMIYAGTQEGKTTQTTTLKARSACAIGIIQGICLPFRGFSRSGSTISFGLLLRLPKEKIEEFSFALAVVLTPIVIAKELHRLLQDPSMHQKEVLQPLLLQSGLGMILSFLAGLVALRWLSRWLQEGLWKFFGVYCLIAASGIAILHFFFL